MKKLLSFAILAASLGMSGALAGEMAVKNALTLEVAKEVAAAAAAHAKENDWNVIIAIVDDGGNLLYFERMDGAMTASIDIAIGKAKTAMGFKRPSKKLGDAISGGRPELLTLPNAMTFDGGYPLIYGDEYVGGIGVSGVTSEQDGFVAMAGAEYLAGLAND